MKIPMMIAVIVLFGVICAGAGRVMHQPPNPGIFTGDHPSKITIWIASDGKYYGEIEGFKRNSWGYTTVNECMSAAKDRYLYWVEKNTRSYRAIGTYDFKAK